MVLRRGRQPEENISRARTVLSTRVLYCSSLMEKRYLAMGMWLCECKLKVKIAHFRLPSASQKRAYGSGERGMGSKAMHRRVFNKHSKIVCACKGLVYPCLDQASKLLLR